MSPIKLQAIRLAVPSPSGLDPKGSQMFQAGHCLLLGTPLTTVSLLPQISWLVTFNAKKTKPLSLSRPRNALFPSIHIGPLTLPEVHDLHLLGLVISQASAGRSISRVLQRVLPCEFHKIVSLFDIYTCTCTGISNIQ